MSHDVDWPLAGPGKEHILARRDRFSEDIIRKVESSDFNPYHGIQYIMDLERELGLRSTFFFRPSYDDGSSVSTYSEEMRMLLAQGFEVGAHLNDSGDLQSVQKQKKTVEDALGSKVIGVRLHYLRIAREDYSSLKHAGFLYDSSLVYSKDGFDQKNTGYTKEDSVIVFPITFMDAYLFSYSKLSEDSVVDYILSSLASARSSGVKLVTILWHDNAILMRGGKAYAELLRRLVFLREDIFIRGRDAYELVLKGELSSN